MRIVVILPKGRAFPGKLRAFSDTVTIVNSTATLNTIGDLIAGPFKCFGKADNFAAIQHDNPTRDPLKSFGDTPTGTYDCTLAAPGTDLRSYGPHKRICLRPLSGQALDAANDGAPDVDDDGHRAGLMIHGGAPGNGGGLRPTHGCLRLSNSDMEALLKVFSTPCILEVIEI